jgi:enoyl-[acyl-carrier protein] reductase I
MAHDISSYSLTALSKAFKDSLNKSSSIVTLSYIGAERVVQNYNIMGVAKASLECSVNILLTH